MLAIISFTLLGLWTALLGIVNHSIRETTSLTEKTFDQKRPQKNEAICADTKNSIEPSKTLEAFKNLWKEIFY